MYTPDETLESLRENAEEVVELLLQEVGDSDQEPASTGDLDQAVQDVFFGPLPVAKNRAAGKVTGAKYKLLTKSLALFGKVPQQQLDLSKLLSARFEVGTEIPESTLFAALIEDAHKYPSIQNSVQDPTYLFRYYRGLKHKGTHAGFIARGFLQQVG